MPETDYTVVPANDIKHIIAADGTILDVRRPDEHEAQHLDVPHARMELDRLNPKDFMLRHGLDRDASVYILCKAGMRARKAADEFIKAGYKNIFVIDGGLDACIKAGEPVSGNASNACARPPGKPSSPGGCA